MIPSGASSSGASSQLIFDPWSLIFSNYVLKRFACPLITQSVCCSNHETQYNWIGKLRLLREKFAGKISPGAASACSLSSFDGCSSLEHGQSTAGGAPVSPLSMAPPIVIRYGRGTGVAIENWVIKSRWVTVAIGSITNSFPSSEKAHSGSDSRSNQCEFTSENTRITTLSNTLWAPLMREDPPLKPDWGQWEGGNIGGRVTVGRENHVRLIASGEGLCKVYFVSELWD